LTLIRFVKVNNTFSRIISDDAGAIRTLQTEFTFTVPNAHFAKKANKFGKKWDGKIRLLRANGMIYTGLKDEVQRHCEDRGWGFEDPEETDNTFPTSSDVKDFCDTLNLTSDGQPIEVRDYQLQYITRALQNRRTTLLCPTSGGKSLIAYVIIRWALAHGLKRCLLTVPSIHLVSQMATDFVDYGWSMDNIHQIYEGAEKPSEKPVTISTWQGIQNENEFLFRFDFMIGDEAHLYKAKALVSIMENLINAGIRIGMSGSLDGQTTSRLVIEGLFGPCYRVIKTSELIERGYSAELNITALVLTHANHIRQSVSQMRLDYEGETQFLYQCQKRNEFLAKLALGLNGNTLLFYERVDAHGQLIYDAILRLNTNPQRRVYYIHGGTSVAERERIRHEIETTNDTIVVCSFGTTSTGSNYKSIHNMIFGSSYKSLVRNLQTIGRGLRKSKIKHVCNLYDVTDNLSWQIGSKVRDNYYMKHFKDRLGIYTNEGFRFRVVELDL
jgi:superfamily II DNA or RNA helicase